MYVYSIGTSDDVLIESTTDQTPIRRIVVRFPRDQPWRLGPETPEVHLKG